jgi:hypothetical protein
MTFSDYHPPSTPWELTPAWVFWRPKWRRMVVVHPSAKWEYASDVEMVAEVLTGRTPAEQKCLTLRKQSV